MYTYYTVQRGDTLKGIADSFGIGVEQIQGANGIMNANQINAGETKELDFKIVARNDDQFKLDLLNMESKIKLTGTYSNDNKTEEVNKEKSRIQGYIDTIYYIQTEKKEIQVEKAINTENKLIFLETATGSIYAENDLFSIPEEYYQTFKELLLTIKKGTFKNVRTFSSNHKTLNSISEVKDFKTRVVFERLGKNTYAIIDIFVKKSDNDAGYRTALVNRVDYYKKTKSYLQEMIKDDTFLEKNRKIEENLINGLENKKLIKTGKGGNQSGK